MYQRIEIINNLKIDFIVVTITITLRRSLAAGAVHFWRPAKFENLANPGFENHKHLQNPITLSRTVPCILYRNINVHYVLIIARYVLFPLLRCLELMQQTTLSPTDAAEMRTVARSPVPPPRANRGSLRSKPGVATREGYQA